MNHHLLAISPVDGRYGKITEKLSNYFSEYALIYYRVRVEIEYFIALCEWPLPQLKNFDRHKLNALRDLYLDFDQKAAEEIKQIEKETNHDVKAVEYYLKNKFDGLGLSDYKEFIHFGLTSQDINNTAVPLSLKEFIDQEYIPLFGDLVVSLNAKAQEWLEVPMLAHTHGQPASPTRLGKEIMVFVERLDQQLRLLRHVPYSAKFGGATGNMNAHQAAYPDIDWRQFAQGFCEDRLGLQQSWPTTQIEHYDHLAALFDALKRINTIIIDLNRDLWAYISMNYFGQKIKSGEVGSSAMPHKVNPIDFENSEGNLGIANALFAHLSGKLPISRLQRDLTDSTVLRNIGVPLGHTVIAIKSTLKGLDKLVLNEQVIRQELDQNWVVLSEAIQNILRREGYPKPYEALKALTRGKSSVGQADIENFVKALDISDSVKQELLELRPEKYLGLL